MARAASGVTDLNLHLLKSPGIVRGFFVLAARALAVGLKRCVDLPRPALAGSRRAKLALGGLGRGAVSANSKDVSARRVPLTRNFAGANFDLSPQAGRGDSPLFDHLVGARDQDRGKLEAERLRGLQIDRQL